MNILSTLTILFGTVFECFNTVLYMHFMFIFAYTFFPDPHSLTSQLMNTLGFALGFIAQPLGSVYFGSLGDRRGRRHTIIVSVCLSSFAMLAIGLLPSYGTIGFFAPILLIGLRFVLGACTGGEVTSANLYLVESAPDNLKATYGSLLNVAYLLGAILAFSIALLFSESFIRQGGWRWFFLSGALLGMVTFFIRHLIIDQKVRKNTIKNLSLWSKLKSYRTSILLVIFLSPIVIVPFQLTHVYYPEILRNYFALSTTDIIHCKLAWLVISLIGLPIMGYISDRTDIHTVMFLSTIMLLVCSVLTYCVYITAFNLYNFFMVIALQSFCWTGVAGPCCYKIITVFRPSDRGVGIGFSWSMGLIIFSLGVPFTWLMSTYSSQIIAPIIATCLSGLSASLVLYKFEKGSKYFNSLAHT